MFPLMPNTLQLPRSEKVKTNLQIELPIRKLHLINDRHVESRVDDQFDPYEWIILWTIRKMD